MALAERSDGDQYDDLQAQVRFLEVQARQGILPACATGSHCDECPFSPVCPIAPDRDFMALLHYYSSLHAVDEQLKQRRLNAVIRILKRHRLPMHWELVAGIVEEEEPKLFPSHRSVLGILTRNPDRFSEDSSGSYFLGPH